MSACERSVKLSQKPEPFLVVAYNPLAWPRKAAIRVPIASNDSTSWAVKGEQPPSNFDRHPFICKTPSASTRLFSVKGELPTFSDMTCSNLRA